MDKNWYTNESVWILSLFYPDLQEDLTKKKEIAAIRDKYHDSRNRAFFVTICDHFHVRWNDPEIREGKTVSSMSGHLAKG